MFTTVEMIFKLVIIAFLATRAQGQYSSYAQPNQPSQPDNNYYYETHYTNFYQYWNQNYEENGSNCNLNQYQPNEESANRNANQNWNQPNEESANRNDNPNWNQPNEEGANRNANPNWNQPNEESANRNAGSNQQTSKIAPMYNETNNPCTRKIVKPNFYTPGRRISKSKCLEFIWQIKAKQDKILQDTECRIYKQEPIDGVIYGYGFRNTVEGEFPHMGALGWRAVEGDFIFKCAGSIISPKFIVTAGHCTKSRRDPRISNQVPAIVRIGVKNLKDPVSKNYLKDVKIVRIIRHPNYDPPRRYFDIALMELEKDVEFDENVQPACLWSKSNTDNLRSQVSSSGWGATETSGGETVAELGVGDLDLINNNLCNQLLTPMCDNKWCGLQEHQICAGKLAGGVDPCQGDSGGPLQVRINLPPSIKEKMYYLLGVTSFGFGCANQNSPGVYTRISSFVDWIEQTVWPNEYASYAT